MSCFLTHGAFISKWSVGRCGVRQILECDPLFCGLTPEENGRLRQLYAKYWQTKLKLNKYRNMVGKLRQLDDDALPPEV